MKYLSLLFCIFLVACGGHEKAGSGETTRTISANNWPKDLSVKEDELFNYDPQVQSNLEGSISYTSENLPSWAQLNSKTGVITGTPTNDDSGRKYSKIKLLVNNGDSKALEIGPFSIDVVAVNDAPEISAQSIQANKSNVAYEGELAYVDIDNTVNQLTFEITKQPEHADVEMVLGTSKFRVVPKSFEVFTSQQSFDVKVKDGSEETESVTIDFSLMDEKGFSFHSNIPNDASVVSVNEFQLSSSHPINPSDIKHNTQSGACVGNIQISYDDFETCSEYVIKVVDNFNMVFSISFDMEPAKNYRIKSFDGLKNIFGMEAEVKLDWNFNTLSELLITEFSGSYYNDRNRWFEIYNPSNQSINLQNYAIRSDGIRKVGDIEGDPEWFRHADKLFPLPDFELHSGQYVTIRSQDFRENKADTLHTIYIGDSEFHPYWWNNGGQIELLKEDREKFVTVDFVKFGDHFLGGEYQPETAGEWVGSAVEKLLIPSDQDSEAYSYQRGSLILDTNSNQDWTRSIIATPGNPNDLQCSEDDDFDGLPDCTEEEGSTLFGVDLYALGARKGQKDIFIEVDYMNSTDEGVIPRREAIEKVKQVFSDKGIKVHFDVGGLFGVESEFNLGGGNLVEFKDCVAFEHIGSCQNFYQIKSNNMSVSRLHSFHYMLFGYQTVSPDVKGQAEINGNDIMILLGGWDLSSVDKMSENELINYQAATIMHELGHNLGLRHGGNNDLNFKPNYLSVMNYIYAFNGLPEIGDNDGDRYYTSYWKQNAGNCFGMESSAQLVNSPFDSPENFVINYSNGDSVSIDEKLVFEEVGLGRIGSSSVDFDCDGKISNSSYKMSLADYPNTVTYTLLHDFNDWSALNLVFQKSYDGVNDLKKGSHVNNHKDDRSVVKVGDDRSEVAQEPGVTQAFNLYRAKEKQRRKSLLSLEVID